VYRIWNWVFSHNPPKVIQKPPLIEGGFFLNKNFIFCRNALLSHFQKQNAMQDAVKFVQEQFASNKEIPNFKAGDSISVNYKIIEGNKERIQTFKGVCLKRQGQGITQTFTVRKMSDNVGVERTFPVQSPNIESIEVNKVGRVRRAKIFYLRERSGKSARIKEKRIK
jgi:large subunit ribosomal protein L19